VALSNTVVGTLQQELHSKLTRTTPMGTRVCGCTPVRQAQCVNASHQTQQTHQSCHVVEQAQVADTGLQYPQAFSIPFDSRCLAVRLRGTVSQVTGRPEHILMAAAGRPCAPQSWPSSLPRGYAPQQGRWGQQQVQQGGRGTGLPGCQQ
jgi:hypothetical protein